MRKGMLFAMVLVALMLAGPVAFADMYPESVSGDVIKIGMTISLSGKFATEGQQALCGVKAVIKWYNDQGGVDIGGKKYKLQLVYYNDESSKDNVASLYTKLITTDKVDFLLAPYSSGLTLAALPVAEQNNKLILSHGGASDSIVSKGYYYIVQVLTPASRYLEQAAVLVHDKIPNAKVALIFENAAFAQAVKKGLKSYLEKYGVNVVYEADYEPGTSDFSVYIQSAKQKGADVLLGGGHYEDGKALVKQAHDSEWSLKFIAILVAPAQPKFYDELGEGIVNGVAYPSQWSPKANYNPQAAQQAGLTWAGPTIDDYLNYFHQVCPDLESPAYQSAEAGAAVVYLVEAIKKANEMFGADAIKDSAKVREAFNDLKIMTFFGPLWIDPDTGKQMGHPMLLMQWQGKNRVIVYPPEYAEASPLIAAPNWQFGGAPATTTTQAPATTTTQPASPTKTTTTTTAAKGGMSTGLVAGIVILIIIIVAVAWYAMSKK
ncbi:MAG: amino acid ABC transporter substrate-binding protein [Desulfurococcales archaeon]|nr:amino acid ABC transporter substrate-binding protein [Desulfurococcales archaeon]